MAKQDSFAGLKIPRSPVYGTKGMVVSGHSLASIAGMRVLERGGSVADAMIATSAVLCVVVPHATSLGGDGFIIHHDAASGRTEGLNASGHAPQGATPEFFKDGMVVRGPLAFSIPGLVRGWDELHKKHGKLPWKDLFNDALDCAEAHPLSRVLAGALNLFRDDVAADPGCHALYYPDDKPMKAGDIMRQPALRRSLEAIVEGRSAAYYEGPIAKSIGDYSRERGGLAGPEDFASYQPEWVDLLSTDYRGLTVNVMPPNSYGLLLLMQLNALGGLSSVDLAGDDATRLAYLIRAQRAAFAEGQRFVADPRTNPAPIDDLLGADMTAKLQQAVHTGMHEALPHPPGGTSCIGIADAEGNAISVVQSVFHVFGGAFIDPGTGILMNNRMTGFRTDPEHPSVVAPGKRPSHTLNPVMIFDGPKLRYILTTPGGTAQTISNVQFLSNLVDRKMEMSVAIEAPRWCIDLAGDILLDEGFSDEVAGKLAAMGFPSRQAPGASYFGSAKTIEVMPNGVLCGAADIRREAYAVGW